MSEPLTIKTQYEDISDLANGFVERVSEGQLVLSAATQVAEGEWTQFIVLLREGTPAFAGVGRCTGLTDNGTRVSGDERYDIVLDSLRFEEDSQAVFDHLVLVKNDLLNDEEKSHNPQDAGSQEAFPIDLNSEELKDFSAKKVENAPLLQGNVGVYDGDKAAPAKGAVAKQEPIPGSILQRPVVACDWQPEVAARPDPRPSSELFRYNGNGLPNPERPPRPELDPSLWVTKAAHPDDAGKGIIGARTARSVLTASIETKETRKQLNFEEETVTGVVSADERVGTNEGGIEEEEQAFPDDERSTSELVDAELEEIKD
jgi:hypothetical protein